RYLLTAAKEFGDDVLDRCQAWLGFEDLLDHASRFRLPNVHDDEQIDRVGLQLVAGIGGRSRRDVFERGVLGDLLAKTGDDLLGPTAADTGQPVEQLAVALLNRTGENVDRQHHRLGRVTATQARHA